MLAPSAPFIIDFTTQHAHVKSPRRADYRPDEHGRVAVKGALCWLPGPLSISARARPFYTHHIPEASRSRR